MAGRKVDGCSGDVRNVSIVLLVDSLMLYPTYIYSPGHVQVVVLEGEPIFFSLRDGQYFPTLRILHQCTFSLRRPPNLSLFARTPFLFFVANMSLILLYK
jgi:hypothetical protein